ncbi:MAG: carbonic anhydrase [Cyanobium sp.]
MPIPLSRRRLLRWAAGLALAELAFERRPRAVAAAEADLASADRLRAQLELCHPQGDPLEALLAGNRRFAALWQSTAGELEPRERMARLAALWSDNCQPDPSALARGQRPWAAVLTCADSRVPPEWLFDVGPGELFDVRSAGNTPFHAGIASLEYAVAELAVPLILVLGHSGCGAVTAAMGEAPLTPLLQELVDPIRACLKPGMDLQAAIAANARATAAALPQGSALLAEAVAQRRLKVAAATVEIGSGAVTLL